MGNINKREVKKQETRKLILQKSHELYQKNGFNVSTAEIAKAADVSHGTIFAHFGTADELITEVIIAFQHIIGKDLQAITEQEEDVEHFLYAHLKVMEKYENFYIALLVERKILPEKIRYTTVHLQSMVSIHFIEILAKEKRQVKDIDTAMLFNTWIALVHYYLQNSELFSPQESVLKTRAKELVQTFMALIFV